MIFVPTLQSLYQCSLNAEVMGYLFLVSQSLCSNRSLPVARAAVSIEFVSRVDFILSLAIVICNAFASLGTSRPDKPKQLTFKKSDDECLHQFHVLFRATAFSQVYNDNILTIYATILTSVKLTASYHLSSTFVFTNNNKVCKGA